MTSRLRQLFGESKTAKRGDRLEAVSSRKACGAGPLLSATLATLPLNCRRAHFLRLATSLRFVRLKVVAKNPATTWLSSSVSVTTYHFLEGAQKQDKLAAFFLERLSERYVRPIEGNSSRHGFTTMAVSCLLIETLEQFWNGWSETPPRQGKNAFVQFISRTPSLACLKAHAADFYTNVRCGILHQGETKGGWMIGKTGPLFDSHSLKLNADLFHAEVKSAMVVYADQLKVSGWNDDIWIKFRLKMSAILANCA
jgi:hypothetical protein